MKLLSGDVMNRKWILLWIVFLFARISFAHGVVLFKNGLWFTGRDFEQRDFYSVDGILESKFDGQVNQIVDLKTGFVIPPLADAHSHALGWKYGIDDQIHMFLERGIFYVMNPNNIQYLTAEIKSKLNTPESVDVIWANGGLTSTGGHPVQIYDRVAESIETSPDRMKGQAYFEIDSIEHLKLTWPAILAGNPEFIKIYLENSQDFDKQKTIPIFMGGVDWTLLWCPKSYSLLMRKGSESLLTSLALLISERRLRQDWISLPICLWNVSPQKMLAKRPQDMLSFKRQRSVTGTPKEFRIYRPSMLKTCGC